MNKLLLLENKYLLAKSAYYHTDNPIISDAEFDELENYLKEQGSNVVKQVGAKIKDFDFKHPTPMLSLGKIQMKSHNGVTNYMEKEFIEWITKRANKIGVSVDDILIGYSNKWDGHAINLVYTNNGLNNAITRGDGIYGNDLTDRLKHIIPEKINDIELTEDDVLEIRCEIVIDKNLFEKKYKGDRTDGKYRNPRNYISSVLNPDEYIIEKVKELTIKPIHYIFNGEHISPSLFNNNSIFKYDSISSTIENHVSVLKRFENFRDSNDFQLDGIVAVLPIEYRTQLGQNSHDPEWSIAIKFLSETAITNVIGLDWSVGKTGELTPVILLEPVDLMGSTVRRASGYNLGYIIKNNIGKGARVSIRKSGDIIPEIMEVIIPADDTFTIIDTCPVCGGELTQDDIHLMCHNEKCEGRKKKQFESALRKIDIKGVGAQTLSGFHTFNDLIDIITWVRENGDTSDISEYGLKFGSKSHENFVNAFKNLYEIPLSKMIAALGYVGVGDTISTQVANMYANIDYDFKGLTKEIVHMFEQPEMKELVFAKKKQLEDVGITVKMPEKVKVSDDTIFVVMTGSPKEFGYKTKGDFIKAHPNMVDVKKLTDKRCNLLITDDLNSTTKKMEDAAKKGISIKSYADF